MKILIDKNKRIMGYAIIGDLKGAIEVEDFNFEYPAQDYIYKNKKIVYSPDIERYKRNKLEDLKIKRDDYIKSDLNVDGDLFQVRNSEDRDKFNRILLGLLLGKLNKDDKEEWRLANNTYKTFTYSKLAEIPELYSNREREAFKKFHKLENDLKACKSIEEIEAIKWE